MNNTKRSPFSQFDPNYYKTLKTISASKAEEYRQQVTKAKRNTIDLWERFQNRESFPQENEIRVITPQPQTPLRKEGTIDLAEQFSKGRDAFADKPEPNQIPGSTVAPTPSVDLSQLIENPWVTESELLAEAGITPRDPEDKTWDAQSEDKEVADESEEQEDVKDTDVLNNEDQENSDEKTTEETQEESQETEAVSEIAKTEENSDEEVTAETATVTADIEKQKQQPNQLPSTNTNIDRENAIAVLKANWHHVPGNIGTETAVNKAKELWLL